MAHSFRRTRNARCSWAPPIPRTVSPPTDTDSASPATATDIPRPRSHTDTPATPPTPASCTAERRDPPMRYAIFSSAPPLCNSSIRSCHFQASRAKRQVFVGAAYPSYGLSTYGYGLGVSTYGYGYPAATLAYGYPSVGYPTYGYSGLVYGKK